MDPISRPLLFLALSTMPLGACDLEADDDFDVPRLGEIDEPHLVCSQEADLDFVVDFQKGTVEYLGNGGAVVVSEMSFSLGQNGTSTLHFREADDALIQMEVFVDGEHGLLSVPATTLVYTVDELPDRYEPEPEYEPEYEFHFWLASLDDDEMRQTNTSQPTVILKPKKDSPTGCNPTPPNEPW